MFCSFQRMYADMGGLTKSVPVYDNRLTSSQSSFEESNVLIKNDYFFESNTLF